MCVRSSIKNIEKRKQTTRWREDNEFCRTPAELPSTLHAVANSQDRGRKLDNVDSLSDRPEAGEDRKNRRDLVGEVGVAGQFRSQVTMQYY